MALYLYMIVLYWGDAKSSHSHLDDIGPMTAHTETGPANQSGRLSCCHPAPHATRTGFCLSARGSMANYNMEEISNLASYS